MRCPWLLTGDGNSQQHIMPGSLTPPDKLNGEMVAMTSTNPHHDLHTMAPAIQTPPSPLPTPSPPMVRGITDMNGFDYKR